MRRAALLALLVVACSDDPDPPPKPPPFEEEKPKGPEIPWSHAQWLDFEVHVPKEWISNKVFRLEGREVHFGGPGAPGKRPELIFGWDVSKVTLDEWASEMISKFENSPIHKVVKKGTTTVAGMNAVYCVVETKASRDLIFYLVGHGHRGFVRGLAPIEDFSKYGAIFEKAAALLRYNPQ